METADLASFEFALREMLAQAAGDNTTNRISLTHVREWTADYLREHAEETKRFSKIKNDTHWNLFAYDAPNEEAVFVIVTFTSDHFGILVGRGNHGDVRNFGENFIGDISAAIEDAQKRFTSISDVLELPIQHAYYWLESN